MQGEGRNWTVSGQEATDKGNIIEMGEEVIEGEFLPLKKHDM